MSCLQSPSDQRTITSRPKLTLQTTSLPLTFGSSTTGLSRSFTASATASPTVRNTFKNAYEVPSPSSTTTSPSKPSSLRLNTKPGSPYIHHPTPNPSFSYRSSYTLPLGVRSILRNSPLEGASRRRSGSISAGTSGPGGAGARRVFFPAKKQVSFRHNLEEEIRTERYTAQHLDLVREDAEAVHAEDSGAAATTDIHTHTHANTHTAVSINNGSRAGPVSGSESDSDSSSISVSESSTDEGSADETGTHTLSKEERKKRRTLRIERQVRAVALLDGIEADPYSSTPQTPRQDRVKRRREWKWTLGPIEGSPDSAQAEMYPSMPFEQPACVLAGPQPKSKFQ